MIATAAAPLTLVVSRGQSRHPDKRGLEQAIADGALQIDGVDVLVVPHLYDLPKDGESIRSLREIEGDLVVASWVFPRAARWVLDRGGIAGTDGEVRLDDEFEPSTPRDEDRVASIYPRPERTIHCLDLKTADNPDTFLSEIRRIVEARQIAKTSLPIVGGRIQSVDETTGRRWYPVIDFDRCTNCMECIDFCLFGVYGVDGAETILVEQPDNCRKGCPACSRVCPENAILFPQHKAPAIAGAIVEGTEGFKIDLSLLFGAPAGGNDPIAVAARERDEQLLLTGQSAVGIDSNLRKRQTELAAGPKDSLDRLIDQLDELEL